MKSLLLIPLFTFFSLSLSAQDDSVIGRVYSLNSTTRDMRVMAMSDIESGRLSLFCYGESSGWATSIRDIDTYQEEEWGFHYITASCLQDFTPNQKAEYNQVVLSALLQGKRRQDVYLLRDDVYGLGLWLEEHESELLD